MPLLGPLLIRPSLQCASRSCLTNTYSSLCAIGEMTTWAPISGTFPHFGMSTLPWWLSSTEPTHHYLKPLDGLILLWDSLLDGYVINIPLNRLSNVALRIIFIPTRTLRCGWFQTLIGSNIWHSISTPVEITAAVILLSFWDTNVSNTS